MWLARLRRSVVRITEREESRRIVSALLRLEIAEEICSEIASLAQF